MATQLLINSLSVEENQFKMSLFTINLDKWKDFIGEQVKAINKNIKKAF